VVTLPITLVGSDEAAASREDAGAGGLSADSVKQTVYVIESTFLPG
jgi:hypothetical protein